MNKMEWWEKPGLGIMFQIEARPGWRWNRNYDKFNASMKDKKGNLNFIGPFCKMKEWVEFSKKVGVDYHIFESKWHDGICYFNSEYTNWKTPEDYCKIFADESKKAEIPFMFYYSSIFDHSPQFNDIQPLRCCTPSFLCMHTKKKKRIQQFSFIVAVALGILDKLVHIVRKIPYEDKSVKWFDNVHFHDFIYNPKKYEIYLFKQLIEIIEKYQPNGMWMDWYMLNLELSAPMIMEFMKKRYPDIVLTFNQSIDHNLKWAHYTSNEAHDVKTAWNKGNKYRRKRKPWELVGPIANGWDNPLPRSDPYEAARMASIIIASGGKFAFGTAAQMNGALHPKPARDLEIFGRWYKKRRLLFTEATPMDYKGKKVPGLKIKEKFIVSIGCIQNNDILIHLISMYSIPKNNLTIEFSLKQWRNIEKIILEPAKKELDFKKDDKAIYLIISKEDIERIDTILRIRRKG